MTVQFDQATFLSRYEAAQQSVVNTIKASGEKIGAIGERLEEHGDRLKEIEQRLVRRPTGGPLAPQSWGRAMVQSEEFKALAKAKSGKARIEIMAMITTSPTSGGGLIPTDERLTPVMLPQRRLRVRDLLTQSSTTANSVKYMRQIGRTNNASVVSEGGLKPESSYSWAPQTADVTTIAHWVPCSKQSLDDAPVLESLINSELTFGVDNVEEQEILLGDGTSEHLSGLIPNATIYSAPFLPESPNRIDAIQLAVTQMQALEIEATGVVLNSVDWSRIRTTKDSNGNYIAGSPLGAAPKQLWELQVVSSNSIPAGHFLLGDFKRAATLYSRQETTVEISTEATPASVGDAFTRNLLIVRAEKRVALAVQIPAALIYGTFQAST